MDILKPHVGEATTTVFPDANALERFLDGMEGHRFAVDIAGRPWILFPGDHEPLGASYPTEGEEMSEAVRSLRELDYPVTTLVPGKAE